MQGPSCKRLSQEQNHDRYPIATCNVQGFVQFPDREKSERTIVITKLPLSWKSNTGVPNDITSLTTGSASNSIQQYTPENYDPKADYLDPPCEAVASLINNTKAEEDLRNAAIHVWVSMTDIVDYAGAKGNSVSFLTKELSVELSSYFMKCFQVLADAGKGSNPVITNINANRKFLNCLAKFKRVTKGIVNELRGEGYMVSWGGSLWRELFPFMDTHGKIRAKGMGDKFKMIAVGVLEEQLYREKTIMKCMFPPQKVSELDHIATVSGIDKNEGLVDDPPDEYKFEDATVRYRLT